MKVRQFLTALLFSISGFLSSAYAQGPSKEDYNRAVSFLWNNLTNNKVFNTSVQPVWFGDSTGVGFVTRDKSGKYFNKVVFKEGKVTPWFDQEKVAQLLSGSLKIEVKANDLPVITVSARSSKLTFRVKGKNYEISFPGYELKLQEEEKRNELEAHSPDGKWIAYMKEYNLFIRSTSGETVKQLSHDGKRGYEFGTYYGWSDIIEGENGERPARLSVNWSPDSKFIQTYITDLRNAEKMYLLDWSIDSLYKPKLLSYYRGSPGDTTMVKMIPVFYTVETGEEYIKQELKSTHTNPIDYRWSKQPGIAYQENAIRGYQAVELHRCDILLKSEELLYRETSSTNIDNYQTQIIEEWGKAVITSERDGWKQLWLLDIKDKSLKRITSGIYYVNQVVHVDKKNRVILFLASGKEPGRNPYHQHFYKL